jgi:hypothetical protein
VIRRSFRVGLWLGIVGGVVLAVMKTVQARRPAPARASSGSPGWPKLAEAAPVRPEPVAPATTTRAAASRAAVTDTQGPVTEPAVVVDASPELTDPVASAAPVVSDPLPDPGPTPVPPPQPEPIPDPVPVEPQPTPPPEPLPAKAPTAPAARAAKAAKAAKKAPPPKKAPVKPWVDPEGNLCPASHPVKAKLASSIFHLPGMLNYGRCVPDRCYRSADAAEADGLRAAKR